MDISKLPTDNLYKFIAISGVALLSFRSFGRFRLPRTCRTRWQSRKRHSISESPPLPTFC